MIILYFAISLFILYAALILFYWISWRAVPVYSAAGKNPTVSISVIIPARNEEKNIGALLLSLKNQTYPSTLFEVIVIDDHSEDRTAEIVEQFQFARLIRFRETGINSYKKKAIETGIAAATGRLIVTTDADCIVPAEWLMTLASFKEEKEAVFITAPVVLEPGFSVTGLFQSLDFLTLQGITAASVHKKFHHLCNGANLAYEKNAFYEVNGFGGIDGIASGDDLLLMNKIARKNPDKFFYLKSEKAIVASRPMPTWKDFLNQRIRWASKTTFYRDKRITGVLALVYLFNLSFLVMLVAGFGQPFLWKAALAGLAAKTIIEFPFVYSIASFYKKEKWMWWFPFFQPMHILYIILAGFLGNTGRYEWKGRKVK